MKRLTLLLLVLPCVVLGQITPSYTLFQATGKSNDYALADLNQDGKLDIVVASTSGLTWYPNEGDTQTKYGQQQLLATDTPYYTVTTAQLNKDGLTDLVVSFQAQTGVRLAWYKNNGNGSFELKNTIAEAIDRPANIIAKDLNRDGQTDISLLEANRMRVYLNDGEEHFLKKSTLSLNFQANELLDINGDYYPDLLDYHTDGIRVSLNTGFAKFEAPQALVTASMQQHTHITHLNGDRYPDVAQLLWDGETTRLRRHLNDGTGALTSSDTEALNLPYDSDKEVQFFMQQMDADGLLDLVFILDNDAIYWLKALDNNQFAATPTLAKSVLGVALHPEDTNQDNIIDFIEIEGADRYLLLHENDGNGNFRHTDVAENGNILQSLITDINGDSYDDVVAFFAYDNEVRAYINQQGTGFQETLFLTDAPIEQLLDMDNDGDLDALSFSYNRAIWSENTGENTFRNRYLIAVDDAFRAAAFYCCSPSSPKVGDFNGDGIPDILVYRIEPQELSWYDGKNSEEHLIQQGVAPHSFQVGDVDNNGSVDIFLKIKTAQQAHFSILKNDGQGNFQEHPIPLPLANTSGETMLADLNGDNYLDVLQYCSEAMECGTAIYYYENDTTGSFTTQALASTYFSDFEPILVDIDLDGDKDIIKSSNDSELENASTVASIDVLLNDGNQQFTLETISGLPAVRNLQLNDFDKDGKLDILITSLPTQDQEEMLFWARYEQVINNRAKKVQPSSALAPYPNPFSDKLYIPHPLSTSAEANYSIRVFNSVGLEIFPTLRPSSNAFLLDGALLPIGIYYYQIFETDQLRHSGSLLKLEK